MPKAPNCLQVNEKIAELQNRFQSWEYAVRHTANTAIAEAYELGREVGHSEGRREIQNQMDLTPEF